MAKKIEENNNEKALAPVGASDILALSTDGSTQYAEIIRENFGNSGVTLADLDRLKIPGSGGLVWSIPSVLEGGTESTVMLEGVVVGWADKKAWWVKSFDETGGGIQPDCKSEDTVYGIGDPTKYINDKEQALIDDPAKNLHSQPVRDVEGWLCNTCVHNQFGSAPKGGGKSCQDKRLVVLLLRDSVLPVLIRVPATSIPALKQYFKRLAGSGKSYYSVLTSLALTPKKGGANNNIDYSEIVPKATRYLLPDELVQAKKYQAQFQPMLEADNAVEAGIVAEKNVTAETLDDMPAASNDDQKVF